METQKIWDMTFKTLLLETPNLFLPLIQEVFGVKYKKGNNVILLNTEFYNKDGSRVIADTSFCIADKKYHFECQFSNEKDMVVRMFEYDFHIGMPELKKTPEYLEFNFPRSCVVYVSNNKNNPTKLKMKLNFQDGTITFQKNFFCPPWWTR